VVLAGVAVGLLAGAIAACGSAGTHAPSADPVSQNRPATPTGFAGYKWRVVTIEHDEKSTSIPVNKQVYLAFAPNGQFVANEPINTHSGTYKVTPGGFTTNELASTVVGWAGGDPVVQLSIDAISAFDNGPRALTRISGNTLTVTVSGYTLVTQREGAQANWPAPQHT
jgi:heat shock protein HslJ